MQETSKKYIWGGAIALVIACPIVLFSDWGLGKVQGYVDEHQNEPWACEWQDRIATSYAWTLRPDQAVAAYEHAYDLYKGQGRMDEAVRARYQQAVELEDLTNGKYRAAPIYEEIAATYPEHPCGIQAKGALLRIHTMSRP